MSNTRLLATSQPGDKFILDLAAFESTVKNCCSCKGREGIWEGGFDRDTQELRRWPWL